MSAKQLAPHQQRVVTERDELRTRLAGLMTFGESDTFAALPEQEQDLLVEQSEVMAAYLEILNARIAIFQGAKLYACHKQVMARPISLADYNALRGWTLPANQDGADEGYLVEYLDGGEPNVAGYAGYISWSPKKVFEQGYTETK